jgi:hypothetical protein
VLGSLDAAVTSTIDSLIEKSVEATPKASFNLKREAEALIKSNISRTYNSDTNISDLITKKKSDLLKMKFSNPDNNQ